jgi:hypothetical protein
MYVMTVTIYDRDRKSILQILKVCGANLTPTKMVMSVRVSLSHGHYRQSTLNIILP